MRYYIIAGERSGDLHGSNLVRALRTLDPETTFRGYGGEYMQQAGVDVAVHYGEMAFMGLLELLMNMHKVLGYLRRCKRDIDAFRPDVIVLIDYGGFNRRMAKYGKKKNIKVFYYIPPKVWAWYQRRAWEIKANVDRLFVILPFEKEFYKKFDLEVDYVGNPVLDAVKTHIPQADFLAQEAIGNDRPVVALLPGSRMQEVMRIIPVMAEVVQQNEGYQFVVAAISNLDPSLYDPLRSLPGVHFLFEKTYDLLLHSHAAIVTSGTATLETALFRVPQVVVYKANAISYELVRRLIRVPFISLVNLIADKEVVKELVQHQANADIISSELRQLVTGKRRDEVLEGYEEIIKRLDTGESASARTAQLMTDYLKKGG